MRMPTTDGPRGSNRLLARLPGDEYRLLAPSLNPVTLVSGETLFRPHEPLAFLYFPLDGVVSLVIRAETRIALEVATIGNEGVVGLPILLGADRLPYECVVQVPGWFLRLPAAAARELAAAESTLRDDAGRYALALLAQISQSLACNGLHPAVQRCARWLLMTHDRVLTEEFLLTHDYLAQMLGVRRATVTTVLGELRQAGLLDYRRGAVVILDRSGLEAAARACYGLIRGEYERLLPPASVNGDQPAADRGPV